MVQNSRKVVKISKRKVKLVFGLVVMASVVWLVVSFFASNSRSGARTYGGGTNIMMPSAESSQNIQNIGASVASKMMPDSWRNNQQIPVSDTREFLKTSFAASIKARDVQSIVSSAKNIIKGNDGRIDSISSSEMSGYLTFVVPKSKFDNFQKEIEGLTHEKLISISQLSQNLLSEKRGIEEQTRNVDDSLDSLKQQKETLLSAHTQMVSTLNRELQVIRTELSEVRKKIAVTEDIIDLDVLRGKESTLIYRETTVKQQLTSENSNYSALNVNLENQIKNQNVALVNIEKQDVNFTENVETVDGSINVNWISIWQLIKVFSPVSPEILVLILTIIIWNILARLGYVPKFILE